VTTLHCPVKLPDISLTVHGTPPRLSNVYYCFMHYIR